MRIRRFIRGALTDAILRRVLIDELYGIRIADFGPPEHQFGPTIAAALELIRETDPRRWQRVWRLRWIANISLATGAQSGQYGHSSRMCGIDFVPSPDVTPADLALKYAGLIVHEATHCLLHERGCDYTNADRRQHEQICHREENRFYRKVDSRRPKTARHLIGDFDETRWHSSWSRSWLEKWNCIFRRIRERHAT